MALFRKKKKTPAKVLPMEEDDVEDDYDEEVVDDEDAPELPPLEPKKKAVKTKKVQPEAPEEEIEQGLTEELALDMFNELNSRVTRLEKHCILMGIRD